MKRIPPLRKTLLNKLNAIKENDPVRAAYLADLWEATEDISAEIGLFSRLKEIGEDKLIRDIINDLLLINKDYWRQIDELD
jgi:hypothetical protein